MLKSLFAVGIATAILISHTPGVLAVPIESVPNPQRAYGGWVTDMAGLLDAQTEAQLNQMIAALEARNGSEIAVVTVPETAPSPSPKAFSTALFNRWGIGKRGRNNGVLFLISKGDRRTEIETGKGLSSILPNSRVSQILQQQVTPRFKQGQFNQGTLAGTQALIQTLNQLKATSPAPQRSLPLQAVPSNPQVPPATSKPATTSKPASTRPQVKQPVPSATPLRPSVTNPAPSAIAQVPNRELTPTETFNNALISLLFGTATGGAAVAGIWLYRRSQRVLLEPEGDSRVVGRESARIHCAVCKTRMDALHDFELAPYLNQPQQVAQQLGSETFTGWRCRTCQSTLYGRGFHLRTHELDPDAFSLCPTCHERTATHTTETTQAATWSQAGLLTIHHTCQCCTQQWQTTETIPAIVLPPDAVTIAPLGTSRVTNFRLFQSRETDRPTHCANCNYPMQDISASVLSDRLTKPERTAQKLGSVKFIAWQCPQCYPHGNPVEAHIRAYVLVSRYKFCPHCEELTLEETDHIVQSATTTHEGRREILNYCHCCPYREERWETIPRLSNSSHSVHHSSSFSSDSSSSSSSSDFGGGSSDGGGSGDSW